jgi:hypothetical protein
MDITEQGLPMQIDITVVVMLLISHLVGDFFLQSDWMALNKSKRSDALFLHAVVYSLCFVGFGVNFYLITWLTHMITDAITSRITSRLWFIDLQPRPGTHNWYNFYAHIEQGKRHWFFVTIGVDQFIHYVTLLYTYQLLKG